MGERFYCIAKGCYDRRIGQIRRAAARARAFWLLVVAALLFGGGYVAYKNGSLSRLIDQASGPPARQRMNQRLSRTVIITQAATPLWRLLILQAPASMAARA